MIFAALLFVGTCSLYNHRIPAVPRRLSGAADQSTPASEVFEAGLDSAVSLIQGGVEFRLQARDGGAVKQILGAARQQAVPTREIGGRETL